MTNEEILKRLAEIEGARLMNAGSRLQRYWKYDKYGEDRPWNPLERWEDCGPLVEKYSLMILAPINRDAWCVFPVFGGHPVRDEDLKRAICLAVIEANGG